ncbi:MAG: ATP-dependent helicase [Candidatus Eisenbacteria bacterium]|uniref:DNA 3'-5' helicase n=1 Tax=Eiseniibacteriota bacterium TaxID=2212470 RepID=A0A849SNK7_UNCEI|nr:ATP-dependent helicase [Candidatus Eisenbacteria bacterium]
MSSPLDQPYDLNAPWNLRVSGTQVLPLINGEFQVLRVSAGPGTGKTFGLRRRVLRILHPAGLAVSPNRVLVCAFNRAIARDLADEIKEELRPHELGLPRIKTIHGLCAELARLAPRTLLPEEEEAMLFDICEEYPQLRGAVTRSLKKAVRALRDHEAGTADHPALAQAARRWLGDHGTELVGDLPRAVERRFANGDFADIGYDHVIVDEFQDLTEVEAKVVVRLVAPGGSLVVLGDRKQSIYSFRGNDRRGLDAITDLVTQPITNHTMNECQRCPEHIVALANAVVALENEPLTSATDRVAQLHHVHFKSPESESEGIAAEVARVFDAFPKEKHLVLVTRRDWGYALRERIRQLEPRANARTIFAEDILETWPAREAFLFLSILADSSDAVALRDWISYRPPNAQGKKFKAPNRNAGVYRHLRRDGGVLSLGRVRQLVESGEIRGTGRAIVQARLRRLVELVDALPLIVDPQALVQHILAPDQWISFSGPTAEMAREDLGRLFREATAICAETTDVTLSKIVRALRYRIATRQSIGDDGGAGVKIVTLWGAKGLTADHVFVLGLIDQALPGPFDTDTAGLSEGEHLDEQRRLLYVSLTRAKKTLVLSRPTKVRSGDVQALGLAEAPGRGWWREVRLCRFLEDLPRGALPDSVAFEHWSRVNIS